MFKSSYSFVNPHEITNPYDPTNNPHPLNSYQDKTVQMDGKIQNPTQSSNVTVNQNSTSNVQLPVYTQNMRDYRQEGRQPRDTLKFPQALPSNSNFPMHQGQGEFVDRMFLDERQKKNNNAVQNDYLQKYQLHQITEMNDNYQVYEQKNIQKVMEKSPLEGCHRLMRNDDDASLLYSHGNPYYNSDMFMNRPTDTRRERYNLNYSNRAPLQKALGVPVDHKFDGRRF